MSVQSNRLLAIENLEANTALEELYLSHNGIEALTSLGHLVQMQYCINLGVVGLS
jgi:protein phosphatase 1 regulatory subunit 7